MSNGELIGFGAFDWSFSDASIAAATWLGDIWIIDVSSGEGKLIARVDQPTTGSSYLIVTDVEFDAQENTIYVAVVSQATTLQESQVIAWDLASLEQVGNIKVPARVLGLAYNIKTGEIMFGANFNDPVRDENMPGLDGFRFSN